MQNKNTYYTIICISAYRDFLKYFSEPPCGRVEKHCSNEKSGIWPTASPLSSKCMSEARQGIGVNVLQN